mmetsp:Transcript_8640/g.12389  ORF Transcript_8640/g.12389 Transcript_8640/m.12389 type:complete len:229 (-) Transcript_8640:20-706(-)
MNCEIKYIHHCIISFTRQREAKSVSVQQPLDCYLNSFSLHLWFLCWHVCRGPYWPIRREMRRIRGFPRFDGRFIATTFVVHFACFRPTRCRWLHHIITWWRWRRSIKWWRWSIASSFPHWWRWSHWRRWAICIYRRWTVLTLNRIRRLSLRSWIRVRLQVILRFDSASVCTHFVTFFALLFLPSRHHLHPLSIDSLHFCNLFRSHFVLIHRTVSWLRVLTSHDQLSRL